MDIRGQFEGGRGLISWHLAQTVPFLGSHFLVLKFNVILCQETKPQWSNEHITQLCEEGKKKEGTMKEHKPPGKTSMCLSEAGHPVAMVLE